MKYLKLIAGLFVAASLLVGVVPTPARADVDVSFGLFYDNLTPHGSWYVSAQYGRVWQPSVYVSDWNPYYDGHWEYTDLGWTWVSDYNWGTIPYHYGTWVMDARYGWVWVPGYTWAPSWVVFRTGNDYCGWAPVPFGYHVGGSINIDPSFFVFVSSRDFLAPRVRVAVLPHSQTRVVVQKTKIINNITVQNNIVVNRGPDVKVVERETGRRIERKPIERVSRVAPFERVSKDRLRVAPDQGGKNARAAEPMSADRPLPERGNRDKKTENPKAPQDRSMNQSRDAQQNRTTDQAKARTDADRRAAEQKRSSENQAKARADADRRAAEQKRAADQAKARADADRRAAEQQSRTQANTTAKQRSERQQKPPADTKAQADARAKAQAQSQAQAKAKAQADAKRKADAAKKKTEPEKKDQTNDQDKH